MRRMHPTTWAIAMGLKGVALATDDHLAAIALSTKQLADEHALPKRDRIVDAAEAGWDLGIRTLGVTTAEVTATRDLDTSDSRVIVTARHDRRTTAGWLFFWAVQTHGDVGRFSIEDYASGSARSFDEAVNLAYAAIDRTHRR